MVGALRRILVEKEIEEIEYKIHLKIFDLNITKEKFEKLTDPIELKMCQYLISEKTALILDLNRSKVVIQKRLDALHDASRRLIGKFMLKDKPIQSSSSSLSSSSSSSSSSILQGLNTLPEAKNSDDLLTISENSELLADLPPVEEIFPSTPISPGFSFRVDGVQNDLFPELRDDVLGDEESNFRLGFRG